jgi:phage baseplate assembly protein gpV
MGHGLHRLGEIKVDSQSNGVTLGSLRPSTTWGDYNNILFVVTQAISKIQTATLVKVMACSNSGDLSPVGTVDIHPLVNQVDGSGNPTPHTTIYNVPYLRIQGGANAVILDPQVGDIGIAVFASRDISKVKSTKEQANPGSWRQYDFSDGMYLGGVLNGVPAQYVQFGPSGLTLVSPTAITLTAPSIVLEGNVAQSGGNVTMAENLTVADVTIGEGTSLHTHVHSGVTAGGANTGEPV